MKTGSEQSLPKSLGRSDDLGTGIPKGRKSDSTLILEAGGGLRRASG